VEGSGLAAGQRARTAGRTHTGSEQRFVRVDVADAGDALLVEQPVADGRDPEARERVQTGGGEVGQERFDSESGGTFLPGRLIVEIEVAESACIVGEQRTTIVEIEASCDGG